jgi:hypothetical protein
VARSAHTSHLKRTRHAELSTLDDEQTDLVEAASAAIDALASKRLVVLAIDNVEHADAPLLNLLERASAAENRHFRIVATTTPGALLPAWFAPSLRLEVGPLGREDVRAMVAGTGIRPDLADALGDHVNHHAADLAELVPIIAAGPPKDEIEVRRLPRRRRASAEMAWARLSGDARRTLAAITWLSQASGEPVEAGLVSALVPDADLPAARRSGWIAGGTLVAISDPLHAEIALAMLRPEDIAGFATAVLDHLVAPAGVAEEQSRALLTAAGRAWMRANPGPVAEDPDRRRLLRAADAAVDQVHARISLRDGIGALECFDVAERIARELGANPAELANLTALRARALATAGRLQSSAEVLRRAAATPGLTDQQRHESKLAGTVVLAEMSADPAAAVLELEDALVAVNQGGAASSSVDALMLRLAIARQRSRAGDSAVAALAYMSVAQDLDDDPDAARRYAEAGGSTAAAARVSAARVMARAGDDDELAGDELELAARAASDCHDACAAGYWRQLRLTRLLAVTGRASPERLAAFERSTDGPVPRSAPSDSPLQSVLALYPEQREHHDRLAVAVVHAGATLLIGRTPGIAPLLADLGEHLVTEDPDDVDHLSRQLAIRRLHLALLQEPAAAAALVRGEVTARPQAAGEYLLDAIRFLAAAGLQKQVLSAISEARNNAIADGDGAIALALAQALVQILIDVGLYAPAAQLSGLQLERPDLSLGDRSFFVWAAAEAAWEQGDEPAIDELECLQADLPASHPLRARIQATLDAMNEPLQ